MGKALYHGCLHDAQVAQRCYQEYWNKVLKTITTDNGSEFADSQLEQVAQTIVCYTSCEKSKIE